MTVGPLLEQLHRDAEAEVAGRLRAARAKAQSIAAELEERLARWRADRLDAARREVERETERERGAAALRASQVRLTARERFTGRVLDAMRARAPARAACSGTVAWVARNLDAAFECFPPGPLIVRASPALVSALRKLGERDGRRIDVRPDESLGLGAVIESPDAALRVEATLESLLYAERPRLAIQLVRMAEREPP